MAGLMPADAEALRQELVFGLVGPVGVDLDLVSCVLQDELGRVGYRVLVVNLAKEMLAVDAAIPEDAKQDEFLRNCSSFRSLPAHPKDLRYNALMSAGNCLRELLERADALAFLGVHRVRQHRLRETGKENLALRSQAYVFDQLKHPQEVQALRATYGPAFLLVGVHSTPSVRRRYVANKIAASHDRSSRANDYLAPAAAIITRDEKEDTEYGQNVRETFPMADVLVNASDRDSVRHSIRRFIELLFGNTLHTPYRDEYGMALAMTAALRSGSLARQVGASIAASDGGDVFALGLNEVPAPSGGLYWAGDEQDAREQKCGEDPSDRMRREVLADILRRLKSEGLLTDKAVELDNDAESVDNLLSLCVDARRSSAPMKSAEYTTLIEHSRTVHAEMAALMNAARSGISVNEATLYTSTFPCHLCARHIVAAGLNRVVFVEPYPKSRVVTLHSDAIKIDGEYSGQHPKPVSFETFVGVSPRAYSRLFRASGSLPRKDRDGCLIEWKPSSTVFPRLPRSHNADAIVAMNEALIYEEFLEAVAIKNITLEEEPPYGEAMQDDETEADEGRESRGTSRGDGTRT